MGRIKFSLQLYLKLIPVLLLTCFAGLLNSPVYAAQLQIPGFYGGTATIPDTQLPVPQVNAVAGKFDISSVDGNMTVDQQQERVVIDWESFDVGKNASVHFDQEQSNWAALNRIYDIKPSQILGKLSADGKVYLINQNGILFGSDSTVNVRSLVASALNIADADFLNSEMKYRYGTDENGQGNALGYLKAENIAEDPEYVLPDGATVSNHGLMTVEYNGSVYLIAPNVENYGEISVAGGRVSLIGGEEFSESVTTITKERVQNFTDSGSQGNVVNSGLVAADFGIAGMYGRHVVQNGVVRSVTALKKNGRIELFASDKITTGAGSSIVSSVSESDDKANDSFQFSGGEVVLKGLQSSDPVDVIDHNGTIIANSGSVQMTAEDRILLGTESSLDVSGVWASRSGASNEIEAQLNSVQLRDEYVQKDGLLQGETVTFSAVLGSGIGDVSGHLTTEEKTALERATAGGSVSLTASTGEIVVHDDAIVDISGGGILFDQGVIKTSKLLSGNSIVDISDASDLIEYEAILSEQTFTNDKYENETYSGLYYGGTAPLASYAGAYIQGSDAGSLQVVAPALVFNGIIDGSVVNGIYQTELEDPVYDYEKEDSDKIAMVGRSQATAGQLTIGVALSDNTTAINKDHVVNSIVIAEDPVELLADFSADPLLSPLNVQGQNIISSDILSASELSRIELYANQKVTFEQGTVVEVDPGGSLKVHTRAIEHLGAITIPKGQIEMTTGDNVSSFSSFESYVPHEQKIYLGPQSLLSVAGEKIDNSNVDVDGVFSNVSLYVDGGSITLSDKSVSGEGVFLALGSQVDVNAGYIIDENGDTSSADAGSLLIQGQSIVLDGDVSGLSFMGGNGGSLTLHSDGLVVLSETFIPATEAVRYEDDYSDVQGVRLNHDRFESSGFTGINLVSSSDLVIEESVTLSPSQKTQLSPGFYAGNVAGEPLSLVELPIDQIGESSISLKAGKSMDVPDGGTIPTNLETVQIAQNTKITVAPEGSIEVSAPTVEIDGELSAPAGTIDIASTAAGGLRLGGTAKVIATGYNSYDHTSPLSSEAAEATPLPGGTVTLVSGLGPLLLEEGTIVDVSAAESTNWMNYDLDGSREYEPVAANAGSIFLEYYDQLSSSAQISGFASLADYDGGTIGISKTNPLSGMTLSTEDISSFMQRGFSSFYYGSYHSIELGASFNVDVPGTFALDTPLVRATGDGYSNQISATWVTLENTYYPTAHVSFEGDGIATFAGDWIDIKGDMLFSGFAQVSMFASKGLRLSDYYYLDPASQNDPEWSGRFSSNGALVLEASVIFPETTASFSLVSAKDISLFQPQTPVPVQIVSAGGNLFLSAENINHSSTIVAPSGQISFAATNRVFLSEKSTTSTKSDYLVPYGDLDVNGFWTMENKESPNSEDLVVSEQPDTGVYMSGQEVIVKTGANVDISGGGGVMSYQFLRGSEGSVSPLDGLYLNENGQFNSYYPDRFVIIPGIELPGSSLQLSSTPLMSAGTYTVLPDEYAFLPSAIVVEVLQQRTVSTNIQSSLTDRYIAVGNEVTANGNVDPILQSYSVRSAEDVLNEGAFNYKYLATGNAGQLQVIGDTMVLDGTLSALALSGYSGGELTLSASTNAIVKTLQALPDEFSFEDDLPGDIVGKSLVLGESFSDRGWSDISIGTKVNNITDTIVVENDGLLKAENVSLYANEAIDIGQDALVEATADTGRLCLITPDGSLTVQQGAMVRAGETLEFDLGSMQVYGDLSSRKGKMRVSADVIYLTESAYQDDRTDGLYLSEDLLLFNEVYLTSRSELVFLDAMDLNISDFLWIDAAGISTGDAVGAETITLSSAEVQLSNSGASSSDLNPEDTATLIIETGQLTIGPGELKLDGFSSINLNSQQGLVFAGESVLNTAYDGPGVGAMTMSGTRLTTTYYRDQESDQFENGNTLINASGRDLLVDASDNEPSSDDVDGFGGQMRIEAENIDVKGTIKFDSGYLSMTTTGATGISLGEKAHIISTGTEIDGQKFDGGKVVLISESGDIRLAQGSVIDVSAAEGVNAGSLVLDAQSGSVSLDGQQRGDSSTGKAGSFSLYSGNEQGLDDISRKLADGGFGGDIVVHTRTGDMNLSSGSGLSGTSICMVADGGSIYLDGTVSASNEVDGGDIDILAQEDLFLNGTLVAGGAEQGGTVLLASVNGSVNTSDGSLVDMSSDGMGGVYHIRAGQTENDVKVELNGQVSGAEQIYVEGVRYIEDSAISSSDIAGWSNTTSSFMASYSATIESRLQDQITYTDSAAERFAYIPGLEVYSSGDMYLQGEWDLTDWRYGEIAGGLTLRAGGDLSLDRNLIDTPTGGPWGMAEQAGYYYITLEEERLDVLRDSWSLNLVAGADLTSADTRHVNNGTGDLHIADNTLVFSESAPVKLSSGRDIVIGDSPANNYIVSDSLNYSLGSFDQDISIRAGRDLLMTDGGIQTATGDINISVERDLDLGDSGAIRTAGIYESPDEQFLLSRFADGGDIYLQVDRSVKSILNDEHWDEASMKTIFYTSKFSDGGASGIISSGGGDIFVKAYGDFMAQTGAFGSKGSSDMGVSASGGVDGRFYVRQGTANITAGGNFGWGIEDNTNQSLEASDSVYELISQGDIQLGSIVNPTVANSIVTSRRTGLGIREITYTEDTEVSITSINGDIVLHGTSGYDGYGDVKLDGLLPASVRISADRDVFFENRFTLLASATGSLQVVAGRDVDGYFIREGASQSSTASIVVSDITAINGSNDDPLDIYNDPWPVSYNLILNQLTSGASATSGDVLHTSDPEPIIISAGRDISNLRMFFPKKAEVAAERDIGNIYLQGQNVGSEGDDVTLVKAGRELSFSLDQIITTSETGINIGGDGTLAVLVGNNLDLGTTSGISTTGNQNNVILPSEGSDLVLLVGSARDLNTAEAKEFFNQLREVGIDYSTILGEDPAAANQIVEDARSDIIAPFFADAQNGEGNIFMTLSSIRTLGENSDIYLVSRGGMGVGQSAFSDDESTGITTEGGGDINIFAVRDIDVLESRVMTKFGGDITVWSDTGNINAGRGSSTAISPGETKIEIDPDTGELVTTVVPAAVGSGIRTLTYDPDGVDGPKTEPELGSVYLFAPTGVIDAGEAGIRGKQVILGATEVLNSQNISFSSGSVGVPVSSDNVGGLGALAGAGNVSEVSKIADDATSMGQKSFADDVALVDDFIAKWIETRVIGYPDAF